MQMPMQTPAPAPTPTLTRESLVQFYTKHEPAKISVVDKLLANFKPEELVQALKQKYGEAPELVVVRPKLQLEERARAAAQARARSRTPRRRARS